MTTNRRLGFGFDRFSGLYLWAIFILIFGIVEPETFLSMSTLHSVAASEVVVAILGIALIMPLATATYDLSIGATANLAAILSVVLQTSHHVNVGLAICASLAAGVIIGVINGFVTVKLGVNSFIATLGMATVVMAVQEIISGQTQPLPPSSATWSDLTQHLFGGFQVIVFYLVAIGIVVWWILAKTPAGRYMYASGGNAEAARLSGVRVDRWIWISLIASGGISAVAGVLFASYSGPSLTFGAAALLPAFAAAFLGSTQINPGRFNVIGTVLAVYILQTGVVGMQLLSPIAWLNDMFNGVALIGAVAFAVWRQRRARAVRVRDPAPRPTDTDNAGESWIELDGGHHGGDASVDSLEDAASPVEPSSSEARVEKSG